MDAISASSSNAIYEQQSSLLSMVQALSEEQQNGLACLLKTTLSNWLGDKLGFCYLDGHDSSNNSIQGENLTTLKEAFLQTPLFIDDIVTESINIAKGRSFTYSISDLRSTFWINTAIDSATPQLDPTISEKLEKIYKANPEYVIGFELNTKESERTSEVVFSIFERDVGSELSRKDIPASQL